MFRGVYGKWEEKYQDQRCHPLNGCLSGKKRKFKLPYEF